MASDDDEDQLEYFCIENRNFSPSPVRALISSATLKEQTPPSTYPITCRGEFVGTHLPPPHRPIFSFSSGRWSKLLLHTDNREVDLLGSATVLEQLMPKSSRTLHLVTYQNGIRNSPKDFGEMGRAIASKVEEVFGYAPLCMGFYNPTTLNTAADSIRALLRYGGYVNRYIQQTAMWFETLLTLIRHNPKLHWLHIAHSEGGAIANLALRLVLMRQQTHQIPTHNIAQHLFLSAFGPLHPIPETLIPRSVNFYNCQDKTTLRFGEKFKDPRTEKVLRPGYGNIRYFHSEQTYLTPFPPGDHSFLGGSYEDALLANILSIKGKLQS